MVNGDREAVDALLDDPRVRAVSFVGSTPVARHVYQRASASGKRVQALGGAKNHLVVLPDADLDLTADALMGAAYGSAGERCMAISVAVAVGDAVADALVDRLAPRVRALKVGPGSEPGVGDGAAGDRPAPRPRASATSRRGWRRGRSCVVDGRGLRVPGTRAASGWAAPSSTASPRSMTIYREEIFGPVLVVVRVPDYRAAVELINAHEYGNGTAIFTRDGDAARSLRPRDRGRDGRA